MADTTARALRLLGLLQSAQVRSASELSQRLGVDARTVRRDVARLAALDVPVEAVRGRYGGYRLRQGRSVLPLMFTAEEAVAVYLEMARTRAASTGSDAAARTALAKITRALPAADAQRVDALPAVPPAPPDDRTPTPDPAVMLALADAVAHRHPVDLRYRNREDVPSHRTVHPTSVVAHNGRWYLVAFDTGAHAERVFRIDRIRTARTLPGTFASTPDSQGERLLADRFAAADYRWTIVLRVHATENDIRAHLPTSVAQLQRLQRVDDAADDASPTWYRVEIHAQSLHWVPPVLAALDGDVVILQPEELRIETRAAARRMLRAAGDTPTA